MSTNIPSLMHMYSIHHECLLYLKMIQKVVCNGVRCTNHHIIHILQGDNNEIATVPHAATYTYSYPARQAGHGSFLEVQNRTVLPLAVIHNLEKVKYKNTDVQ